MIKFTKPYFASFLKNDKKVFSICNKPNFIDFNLNIVLLRFSLNKIGISLCFVSFYHNILSQILFGFARGFTVNLKLFASIRPTI